MPFTIYPGVKQFHNYPSGHPVEANVSFKSNGDFIPLYFRIEINYMRETYKIKAIKSIKDQGNIKAYECTYESYGQVLTVILKFDIQNRIWVVG